MQRTQVYFPKEILDQLRKEAFEKKTTLASVIREKVVKQIKPKSNKPSKKEVAKRMKLLDEITKLNLPTMSPKKMKKIFSETHDPYV